MILDNGSTLHDATKDTMGAWVHAFIKLGSAGWLAALPQRSIRGTTVYGLPAHNTGMMHAPYALSNLKQVVPQPNQGLRERAVAQGQAMAKAIAAAQAALAKNG